MRSPAKLTPPRTVGDFTDKDGNKVVNKVYQGRRIYHRLGAISIKRALEVVRCILNLAARSWRDEHGSTWLESAPLITMPDTRMTARKPYPLSWDEQRRLFELLPRSVAQMALFAVNTGCREQEVCQSRWDWEVSVAELQTSVFVFPAGFGGRPGRSGVKNREDRVVVLNDVAKRVIDSQCGLHRQFLFVSSKGQPRKPLRYMNNTALQTARKAAGLSQVRVHDLKHTFGRRLRTAGVPLETRKVLLGHKTGDIASHYSAPELAGTDTRVECDTQSAGIDLVASGCKAGGQR